MSKKALILGLFVALMASSVGGALGVSADYWSGTLSCSPVTQSVASGGTVSFWASYSGTQPLSSLSWQAVGGYPSNGYGQSFSTQFYTNSINETRVVTVTDGYRTASCTVYVNGSYATPTPYPTTLQCTPANAAVNSGDAVYLSATGGNGSYAWTASEGTPSSGWGSSFMTRFNNYSGYTRTYMVTVTSNDSYYGNYQTNSCQVSVAPYAYVSPTPTVYPYGYLTLDHTVRNVTRGGEGSAVTVYNGDRVQFIARISTGNQYPSNARITDYLPTGFRYIAGTTNVDGTWYIDGITSGGLNLNTLSANRTYTVRFDTIADVGSSGPSTAYNSVTVTTDNAGSQTRSSTLTINGNGYPYPTPIPGGEQYARLQVQQFGRNVTRGQSGEHASVSARGNDTIDFILRIRALSGVSLSNISITDVLPSGLYVIAGSTTLNGYAIADGITSSGISIGTLSANQEAVVKFSARVDTYAIPGWGKVTVNNTAQVRADGATTIAVQLPVTLSQATSIAAASSVKTGPADSALLALLVSVLATGAYAMYTRTALFGRRFALAQVAQSPAFRRTANFSR